MSGAATQREGETRVHITVDTEFSIGVPSMIR